jgi:hypothetical protein
VLVVARLTSFPSCWRTYQSHKHDSMRVATAAATADFGFGSDGAEGLFDKILVHRVRQLYL